MPNVDLDVYRQETADEEEPKTVTFAGQVFTLPASPTMALMDWINELKPGAKITIKHAVVLPLLLGEENYKQMVKLGLETDDAAILMNTVPDLYGINLGKASASSSTSSSATTRSKPTSKRTTASTSRKRSSAKSR